MVRTRREPQRVLPRARGRLSLIVAAALLLIACTEDAASNEGEIEPTDFVGYFWLLETIETDGSRLALPEGASPPTLWFNWGGSLHVGDGCNWASEGGWLLEDGVIALNPAPDGTTSKSCGPEWDREAAMRFLSATRLAEVAAVDGDIMRVEGDDTLITLRRRASAEYPLAGTHWMGGLVGPTGSGEGGLAQFAFDLAAATLEIRSECVRTVVTLEASGSSFVGTPEDTKDVCPGNPDLPTSQTMQDHREIVASLEGEFTASAAADTLGIHTADGRWIAARRIAGPRFPPRNASTVLPSDTVLTAVFSQGDDENTIEVMASGTWRLIDENGIDEGHIRLGLVDDLIDAIDDADLTVVRAGLRDAGLAHCDPPGSDDITIELSIGDRGVTFCGPEDLLPDWRVLQIGSSIVDELRATIDA